MKIKAIKFKATESTRVGDGLLRSNTMPHDTPLSNQAAFLAFAQKYKVSPAGCVVLPALFEKAAIETDTTVPELLEACNHNKPLGDYLSGVAEAVALSVATGK